MTQYNIIAEMPFSTVVSEYESNEPKSDTYQSEEDLERDFIKRLQTQGYEYISITSESNLISNLRTQIEAVNSYQFSNSEWKNFFDNNLANKNDSIEKKTEKIQVERRIVLTKDDGTTKNITLLDEKNIHNNRLQVINQYEESEGTHKSRYDVTILVNGFPMIHVELKRRGVAIREAFNQIQRYQRDSFWASSGLFEYVQIFVISNGTHTKYYSNTTRKSHIKEIDGKLSESKKTSNTFEFTSFWSDSKNHIIADLVDFTKTFFAKHTILNILTRFCVFTSEHLLLVMRPYQIAATERILQRLDIAENYKYAGTLKGGGYIWHTTGSGKTLTSFKTAILVSQLPYIDKVLFVVDRRDLDYQTIKEYDRFKKGAANGNNSVAVLYQQLSDPSTKIIITTIQKLGIFVGKNPKHPVYHQRIVIIFDECHRSQFGEMHSKITGAFKKYHLFGFTGTPIFAQNASTGGVASLKTTEQCFGDKLHMYTIVDAINDGNVLKFRIDYINTVKAAENIEDKKVRAIDKEKALRSPERVSKIVEYILEHFDQKTSRNIYYSLKGQRVAGFNSILAVSSIPMAQIYYKEFKRQLSEKNRELIVATIFTFNPNESDPDDSESFDTEHLDKTSREFLENAIADYNTIFHTNFDTSSDNFQNYYKDLSLKMKERQVDLLIVVNMFLTGFDATTLNTLWVDKHLHHHGLIQAFSRTNRILNSVKTYGNIVCFRDLQKETDEAIALFGDKEAKGIVLLKTYKEYFEGYEDKGKHKNGYKELVENLTNEFSLDTEIIGEEKEKEFISQFGQILRVRNILTAFDDFQGNDILTEREFQDYRSKYLDMFQKYRRNTTEKKEDITYDLVFEIELIRQVEVNIDYILMLVEKYKDSHGKNKEILSNITSAVSSSFDLRNKKDLIDGFVENINISSCVLDEWKSYVKQKKEEDLENLIKEQRLKPEETRLYIENAFRDGELRTIGTGIQKILPPTNPFLKNSAAIKEGIIDKIKNFFNKYLGINF